jgi:hypothetical protein
MVDFGSLGVWLWNGGAWTQLRGYDLSSAYFGA